MPERKRQHYVPRFYLKNFSIQLDGKSIGIFNIKRGILIPKGSLRDQAYRDYFYGKDGAIEEALGRIEGPASKIIYDIINLQKYPHMISEEHLILLTFIILLHVRTQYAADEQNEMVDKFVKKIFEKDKRIKSNLDDIKIGVKNSPQFLLKTSATLIPFTFDLNYKIIDNQTKIGFITSDNPVIFYNQFLEKRKTIGSNIGLAVKGLQILLPISPKFMIIFFDQGVYRVGNKKEKIIKLINDSDINQLNKLQFLNCDSNIYFNEDLSSKYIKDIFNNNKKYRIKSKGFVKEYPGKEESDGTMRSIIHIHKHDIKINLDISFIKIIKRARKYKVGDQISLVRNEKLSILYEEFSNAVDRGLFKPNQFKAFLDDISSR